MEDPAVRELLGLMKQYNSPGQEDLLAMCRQVAGLEKQLNSAMEELAAMRQELAQARESPVKRTLQRAVKALEQSVASLGDRLSDLKQAIVTGCKKTLAAFQELSLIHISEPTRPY